jgi:uncharacterized membrane protein YozB (DUF420 family)
MPVLNLLIATKSLLKGKISTVHLLVLTNSHQLPFKQKIFFLLFYITTYLNEEVKSTEPSPLVRVSYFSITQRHLLLALPAIRNYLDLLRGGKDLSAGGNCRIVTNWSKI